MEVETVLPAQPPLPLLEFITPPELHAPAPSIEYLSASPVLLYHTVPVASEAVGSVALVTTLTPLIHL